MNKFNLFLKENNDNSRKRFLEELKETAFEKSFVAEDMEVENPYLMRHHLIEEMGNVFNKPKKSRIEKIQKPILAQSFKPATTVKSNFDAKKSSKFPLLPLIKPGVSKKSSTAIEKSLPEKEQKVEQRSNRFTEGRKLRLVTGTVDYVLKIHKIYPDLVSLYEVYGKLLKTLKGKYQCEQIIWLKSQQGPVLKVLFYEIDIELPFIAAGSPVFCVGRFTSKGQFHAFKIKQTLDFNESAITRFQNVCNFVLSTDSKGGNTLRNKNSS